MQTQNLPFGTVNNYIRNFHVGPEKYLVPYALSMFGVCILINMVARTFIVQSAIYSHFALFFLIIFLHGLSIQKRSNQLLKRTGAIAAAIIGTCGIPLVFTNEPRETADKLAVFFILIGFLSFYLGAVTKLIVVGFNERPKLTFTPSRLIALIVFVPAAYFLSVLIQKYSVEIFNVAFILLTGRSLLN